MSTEPESQVEETTEIQAEQTAENQVEQAPEQQGPQLTGFKIDSNPGGATTLKKDDTTFTVARDSAVEVTDTGRGVQVNKTNKPTPEKPNPAILFEDENGQIDENEQTITTFGATVKAPADGPAYVATNRRVTLVNPNAEVFSTAEDAEPETGLEVNIGPDGFTGKIGRNKFDASNNNIAADTNILEVIPADEASKNDTDVQLGIRADFNRAVLKTPTGTIRIEQTEEGPTVYSTNTRVKQISAASANIDRNGPTVQVNEDATTRLTLAGGRVYDVNTATNKVTVYEIPEDNGVENAGDPNLAEPAPENDDDYKITFSQDGKRVALNGSGLEQSEDGTLVAATDGIAQIKPAAEAYVSALAAAADLAEAERAQREAAEEEERNAPPPGFVAVTTPDGQPVISPTTNNPLFVSEKDLDGTPTLEEAEQAVEALHEQGITNAHLASVSEHNILSALFNQQAFRADDKGNVQVLDGTEAQDKMVNDVAGQQTVTNAVVPVTKTEIEGFKESSPFKIGSKDAGWYWTRDKAPSYVDRGIVIFEGRGRYIKSENNPQQKHSTRIVLS